MLRSGILCCLLLLAAGCRSHSDKIARFTEAWSAGDAEMAQELITGMAEKAPERDRVVYRLEEGTALRVVDRIEESDRAYLDADARIEAHDEKARTRVSTEAGALLSNQAARPYTGQSCDRIMLSAYLAINRMIREDHQGAAVELRRAYRRQQEAVEENRRRLEEAQAEIESKGSSYREVVGNERSAGMMADIESRFRPTGGHAAFGDYVNPFVEYLQLIFHMAQGQELENLPLMAERLEGMVGAALMKADREQIDRLLRGEPAQAATYAFIETGRAPWLDQVQIHLPAQFIDPKLPYVAAALPFPVYEDAFVADFALSGSHGITEQARLLADFDGILTTDLRNRYPAIVIRTLLTTAAKAAVDAVVRDQMGNAGLILGLVYQIATTIADTRSWNTLPKRILVARIPTPEDRKVRLRSQSGGLDREVVLGPGRIHALLVRVTSPRSGIVSLHQFRIDDPALSPAP